MYTSAARSLTILCTLFVSLLVSGAAADPCGVDDVGNYTLGNFSSVDVVGDTAYLAGLSSFHIVDVSDPTNPQQLAVFDELPDYPSFVQVSDNVAYFAWREQGLVTVDVSDPTNPTLLGSLQLDGVMLDLAVDGDTVYTASFSSPTGLNVIDVSDPANPTLLTTFASGFPDMRAVEFDSSTNRLFVSDDDSGITIVDAADPSSPSVLGNLPIPQTYNIHLDGDTLYVSQSSIRTLARVDVSDPTNPTEIPTPPLSGCFDFRVQDGVLFAVSEGNIAVFRAIDLNDPQDPRLVLIKDPEYPEGQIPFDFLDLKIVDGLAYLASGGQMSIVDVSSFQPLDLLSDAQLQTPPNLMRSSDPREAARVKIENGLMRILTFVSNQAGYMLETIDVTDPSNMTNLGTATISDISGPIEIVDDIVFGISALTTPTSDGREVPHLAVVDISDPTNPTRALDLPLTINGEDIRDRTPIEDMRVFGDTVYIHLEGRNFQRQIIATHIEIDITNPLAPVIGYVARDLDVLRPIIGVSDGNLLTVDHGNAERIISGGDPDDTTETVGELTESGQDINEFTIIPRSLQISNNELVFVIETVFGLEISLFPIPQVPTPILDPTETWESQTYFDESFGSYFQSKKIAYADDYFSIMFESGIYVLDRNIPTRYSGFRPATMARQFIPVNEEDYRGVSLHEHNGTLYILRASADDQELRLRAIDLSPCVNPCPADLDGSGSLNFGDVTAFLTLYGNGDPSVDFDGSGSLNFGDVTAFLTLYAQGCP